MIRPASMAMEPQLIGDCMKAGRMDGAAISTIIRPQPNTKEAQQAAVVVRFQYREEVRSQESAGQCAPGDAHELSDKGHVALILDESQYSGDGDEDHDEYTDDQHLSLVTHFFKKYVPDKVNGQRGAGRDDQGGEGGHGSR